MRTLGDRLSFKLMASTVLVVTVLMSLSVGFSIYQQRQLAEADLRSKVQVVAQQFLATRAFIAENEELLYKASQGHFDESFNPGAVGRGIGEIFGAETEYQVQQVWLKTDQPNMLDPYEQQMLAQLQQDQQLTEVWGTETVDGHKIFHYMVPVYMEEPCLSCHQKDGYQLGEFAGALSINSPMDVFEHNLQVMAASQLGFGLAMIVAIIGCIYFVVSRLVTRPLERLAAAATALREGNLAVEGEEEYAPLEIRGLAERFREMAVRLRDLYAGLEEQVAERTRELTEANAKLLLQQQELQQINAELVKANQVKSDFLANMSHELRTPLTSVLAFAELLLDEEAGEINVEQREYLNDILEASEQLLNSINDLLDFARLEAGKIEISQDFYDPVEIVNAVERRVRPVAARKGICLTTRVAPGLPLIYADRAKIEQVLLNLAHNAVKFTPAGGKVEIILERHPGDPGGLLFAVKDTGIGIAAEDQERIFAKFTQVGPREGAHRGVGLGLALAKELVQLHGGRIWVESAPGQGSCFYFTIPGDNGGEQEAIMEGRNGSQDSEI